jgi:hypothetical protein
VELHASSALVFEVYDRHTADRRVSSIRAHEWSLDRVQRLRVQFAWRPGVGNSRELVIACGDHRGMKNELRGDYSKGRAAVRSEVVLAWCCEPVVSWTEVPRSTTECCSLFGKPRIPDSCIEVHTPPDRHSQRQGER